MRFGNVLLGLVTLTCLYISRGQQCNNGLAGFQNGDACCDLDCGTCGGSRCGRLPGGSTNCCAGQITNSGVLCSTAMAAPCIVDNPVLCSNGLPGVETNGVCCEAQCGTCGGGGCGRRDGGASACCSSRIEESGVLCSVSDAAPCIVDDGLVCSNGLPGVERSGVCCEAQCGTCGGSGCSSRPGGSSACCTGRIEESNVLCSMSMEAPCIIDGPAPPTPAPSMEEGACNPNPCQNGGSCSIDPAGGHVCSCASGFGGMACQIDTSSLDSFFIELAFVGAWSDERMAVFESAAERWSEVVTHVPCGGNAEFPAGRLLITSTLQEIDGVGGTLGSAGPESVWSGCTSISIEGNIRLDMADIADLEADGSFEGVVLHEMGHVIGVGTLWGEGFGECTTCRQTEDPAWICPAALSAFADLGGSGADIVELDGNRGTSCVHLDEDIFEDELMTGFLDNPMFLSKMTTATLDDIDYIVDPSAVDPYVLPSERGASIVGDDMMPSVVNDTAVDAIILVLDDDDGSVVEELTGVMIVF